MRTESLSLRINRNLKTEKPGEQGLKQTNKKPQNRISKVGGTNTKYVPIRMNSRRK